MMRIAFEFGFTPASRSRISAPAKSGPTLFDLMDDYGFMFAMGVRRAKAFHWV
jgi:hypothetical protein